MPRWVAERGTPELRALLDEVRRAYAGRGGFLERHRMKVYRYLEMAFKLGRGVTIGGFRGAFGDRTWDKVNKELVRSAAERPAPAAAASAPATRRAIRCDSTLRLRDARHDGPADGFWLLVDGTVYDVMAFIERHPGGAHTLMLHAGTDATAAFHRVHGGHAHALALFRSTRSAGTPVPDEIRARPARFACCTS